jgi:cytochrome d ubiquinol oxidase subunit I
VLSFEFGLLWPKFMGRWGDAFGVPFAFEGLFFFTEAIFIAIYLFGWRRLRPWAHFWTGVPVVVAGVFGSISVVAANAWMNDPSGFTLDSAGNVVDVDPVEVIFNDAMPLMAAHMIVAAYVVGGFLVASVYAVAMLRGRRDRYHRLGFLIPFAVAAAFTPVQLFVGDIAAREVYDDQPVKFAAMECVYETGDDQAEHLGGICTDDEVKYAISIDGLDSLLAGFSTDTVVKGLDEFPDDEEPPALTMIHLSFDTMVGLGSALFLLGGWFAFVWWRRRELPATRWFLRAAALAGAAAIVALECGWIVTEVGRQPWIVHGYMRTEDAVTGAEGLWFVFAATIAIYAAVGVAAAFILRAFARRWREEDAEALAGPYGPRPPAPREEGS